MPKRIDLTGQDFGELTVVALSDKLDKRHSNTRLWECLCSCGKTTYVLGSALRAGNYKSCGCKRVERRDEGVKRHIETDTIDGTRKSALTSKLHKGNKSGHKGVIWVESRKKWRAFIGIQGKQKFIGNFNTIEEAIEARKRAEEIYHKPYLN